MGFYFGDGNTSFRIRSFRLNNCESSALNYCLDILNELGISRNQIKLQIIYSSDHEINGEVKKRCIDYWSKALSVDKHQIVSVNRSKNKMETLKYGSARVFIDNATLIEILLHGVLNKFIEVTKNPKNEVERKILVGFLRGLLAAEGSVILEKGSLRKIGIAFNPHSGDVKFYKRILENLGISWNCVHGNELIIHKFENFKKLFEMDAFKMHKKRNDKFLLVFRNHKYFKTKFKT